MARTKKADREQKPFSWSDDTEKPIPKRPPQSRARQEIINNPQARTTLALAIAATRTAFKMPRVTSNKELVQRLDEYFELAENRQIPPTVEEMALYCGYTTKTLADWKTGRNKGFKDVEAGLTTSSIIQKAYEMMHNIDAVMVETGGMNVVSYIFRAKNYHGMTDKQEITVATDNGMRPALTPEEIVKNLPEPTDTVNVDTEFSIK